MPIPDFRAPSVWTNVGIAAGAALVVWLAGAPMPGSTCLPELNTALAAVRMGYDSVAVLVSDGGVVGL